MAEDSSGTGDSGSGADGGSSGPGSGTSSGTGDYSQLDWKDVMRYVTGSDPDNPAVDGAATSDPQTVQDAADAFYFTQTVLQSAAENLGQQVEALTGPDGPWQGGAAQALSDAMKTVAKQTQDMADTLSGGITGDYDITQQLADNAAHLQGAIDKLNDIDQWYAQQALDWGRRNGVNLEMPNGRVAVSQAHTTPKLTDLLTRDMQAVLNTLADNYKVSTSNVGYSAPPTNPVNGPGDPDPADYGGYGGYGGPDPYPYMGSGGGGNLPDFGSSGPDSPAPYPDMSSGGDGGNLPGFGSSGPGSAAPYPGGGDFGGAGGNLPDFGDTGAVSPVPYPGGDTGTVGGLSGLGSAGSGGGDGVLPSDYPDLQDYQGDPSLGSGGSLPGDGTLAPDMDAALNPGGTGSATGDVPGIVPYPGLSLGTGAGGRKSDGAEDSGKGLSQYPDSADDFGAGSIGSPGSVDLPGYSAPSEASGYSGSDLPALNTSGIAAPNLGEQFQPYADTSLASDPTGQIAGSPGAVGSSMPMMPMGGMGSGAGGAGAGGSDVPPSDASGLLQGSTEPWQGDTSLGGAGGLPGGTASGGPGLDLPGGPSSQAGPDGLDGWALGGGTPAQGPGATAASTPMMPMMPMGGMGGMGAGNNDGDRPASDASGLLAGDREPWSVTPVRHGVDAGSSPGAAPGAGQLRLPGIDAAAAAGPVAGPVAGAGDSGSASATAPTGVPAGPDVAADTTSPADESAAALLEGLSFLAAGAWGAAAAGSGAGAAGRPDDRRGERPTAWQDALWETTPAEGAGAPDATSAGAAPTTSDEAGAASRSQEVASAGAVPAGAAQPGVGPHGAAPADSGAPDAVVHAGSELREAAPAGATAAGAVPATAAGAGAGSQGAAPAGSGAPDAARPDAAPATAAQRVGPQEGAQASEAGGPETAGAVSEAAAVTPAAVPLRLEAQGPRAPGVGEVGAEVATDQIAPQAGREAVAQAQPSDASAFPALGHPAHGAAQETLTHPAGATVAASAGTAAPAHPVRAQFAGTAGSGSSAGSAGPSSSPLQASAQTSPHPPVEGSFRRVVQNAASGVRTPVAGSTADVPAAARAAAAHADAGRTGAGAPADPVTAAAGPAADDVSSWDAPDTSLLHLLGEPAAGASAHTAGSGALTADQETAALIGAAGAAYAIGRLNSAGEAEPFGEPVRPAWKPKPPGPGTPRRMEFTCATGSDEPPAAQNSDEPEDPDAQGNGRKGAEGKKADDRESGSVADLLRQSEEIWGAGTRRTGTPS